MSRTPSYLKAIVIVHGKSEKRMCEWIKTNLKLNIHIESDKNGSKAIQITNLNTLLTNTVYKSFSTFKRNFDTIEIDKKTKTLKDYFRVFIIMDTDDCTKEQENDFKSRQMFRKHWLCDYIHPIWNIRNLEEVLYKTKVKHTLKKIKGEYVNIFPTADKIKKTDTKQLEEFYQKLKDCDTTNMDEFILFCLEFDNVGIS